MAIIIIELIGGLGLFIAGMNMMSHGIEKVAGSKLRSILQAFTKNKFYGLMVGMFFTAVIQSSSAATVMVVSFVNSGLMALTEACGIILGANIGTTITSILVAFRLSAIAPLFVFAGAAMVNFMKKPQVRKAGEVVLGFGILFIGIDTMSDAMSALNEIPAVIDLLANFTNPFLGVLLGLVVTSIVQSSSVTVSILVVMAAQGLVDLNIGLYVILGCNIGACTSAMLASLNGTKNAKRAALIHLLVNIYGTIVMFVLLLLFNGQITNVLSIISGGKDLGRNIAIANVLFKVFQVAIFYPFTGWIIKCTYIIVPGEDADTTEESFRLQYIGASLPNPAVAIYMAVQEMQRMADMAFENLNLAIDCLIHNDLEKSSQVYATEKYVDFLDQEISNYLVKINQNALPLGDANMIAAYFHVVSDIERIGDHAASIVNLIPQLAENDVQFSPQSAKELNRMMELINRILKESMEMFVSGEDSADPKTSPQIIEISEIENMIDDMERELQRRHIRRLSEGRCSALAGIYFSDVVSGLERVGDHAINIAFSLAEARNQSKVEVDTETAGA